MHAISLRRGKFNSLPETVVGTTAATDLISQMISSAASFDKVVKKTVRWYIENKSWVSGVTSAEYRKRVFFLRSPILIIV